jgi:hypothetical protein
MVKGKRKHWNKLRKRLDKDRIRRASKALGSTGDDLTPVTIYVRFRVGQIVYHVAASERAKGLVTGLLIRPEGTSYLVRWGDGGHDLYGDIELTAEYVPDFSTSYRDDD